MHILASHCEFSVNHKVIIKDVTAPLEDVARDIFASMLTGNLDDDDTNKLGDALFILYSKDQLKELQDMLDALFDDFRQFTVRHNPTPVQRGNQ